MIRVSGTLCPIEDDVAVREIYPLMAQLRSHLTDADMFIAYWRRQSEVGYRLIALHSEGQAVALAGYRVQENLVYGRFLYVDDLITDADRRSQGYGERIIQHLRSEAKKMGCAKLVLDTPMSNSLGHRFYFRCGLLATSLRFSIPVESWNGSSVSL